ncbi:MAG: hypothetical protein JXA33_11075 [Anaerolineae bacterium]|nr:hypothetical protein [Anaerolineae bacterium]
MPLKSPRAMESAVTGRGYTRYGKRGYKRRLGALWKARLQDAVTGHGYSHKSLLWNASYAIIVKIEGV